MSRNESKRNHTYKVIKDQIIKNETYGYDDLKMICYTFGCYCNDCELKLAVQRLCYEQVLWKFGPELVFKALSGVKVQRVW